MHVLSTEGRLTGPVEWETDRARFLGRGRGPEDALAVDGRPLSGTTGAVLDAVASLRVRVRLAPGAFVRLAFSTGVAASRAGAVALAERYRDATAAARAFALAFTHAQIELQHLGIGTREAQAYLALASRLIYPDPLFRASPEVLARAAGGQPALWRHGISGDMPILLLRVVEEDDLLARARGPQGARVLADEGAQRRPRDRERASDDLSRRDAGRARRPPRPRALASVARPARGVFLLRADVMQEGDRLLLAACARCPERRSGRARQSAGTAHGGGALAGSRRSPPRRPARNGGASGSRASGSTHLGPGGGTGRAAGAGALHPERPRRVHDQGREYVVVLEGDRETPLPWAHVLANPNFGTVVTASGSAFSSAENSRENRPTPFANDAVSDPTLGSHLPPRRGDGAVWARHPGPLRRDPAGGS